MTTIFHTSRKSTMSLGQQQPGQFFKLALSGHLYIMLESYRVVCCETGVLSVVSDFGTDRIVIPVHTITASTEAL